MDYLLIFYLHISKYRQFDDIEQIFSRNDRKMPLKKGNKFSEHFCSLLHLNNHATAKDADPNTHHNLHGREAVLAGFIKLESILKRNQKMIHIKQIIFTALSMPHTERQQPKNCAPVGSARRHHANRSGMRNVCTASVRPSSQTLTCLSTQGAGLLWAWAWQISLPLQRGQ